MAFDFRKEYRNLYRPGRTPSLIDVPEMRFLAVQGRGDPNEEGGAYQKAIGTLYAVAFTLKMSPRAGHRIEGFFDWSMPPLEGFWWLPGQTRLDLSDKGRLHWLSVLRVPDFVDEADFRWARDTAQAKKKMDLGSVSLKTIREGLCVQCMHLGPYDTESATLEAMEQYAREQGCQLDLSSERLHHELYLSDPRRAAPKNWKTVLRLPIRRTV